jgi:uncharacterized protein YmfQ (DUF2313 family)
MPAQAVIDRYRELLLNHLPPGDGLTKVLDSVVYDVCDRFAVEFARLEERASEALVEFVPATCTELLDEWEEALGLPEECYEPTTTDERRAAITASIVGTGGHSLADYSALAAALGYDAPTFTTYAPFRMGSRMGDRFTNGPWRSTALVTFTSNAYDALIECAFNHQKMAHETLLFAYAYYLTVDGDYVTVDGDRVLV